MKNTSTTKSLAADLQFDSPLNHRSGLAGWWLNLTAPPRPTGSVSIVEREHTRKAELTSFSILAIFMFLLALSSVALLDFSTGVAVLVMAVGLGIAVLFNRSGRIRIAGYLISILAMLVIAGAILGAQEGLDFTWFPAYDLFAIPIFISSLLIDDRAPWILALIAVAFILGDIAWQPHNQIVVGAQHYDQINAFLAHYNWWDLVDRHITLNIFAAFLGWMGARSVNSAIFRADRAEELAHLEEQYAQAEARRIAELNDFVLQITEAFVAQANGTEQYLQLPATHFLAPTAQFLNQRLKRLREVRDQGIWSSGQVLAAAGLLSERLNQVGSGIIPGNSLHPSRFQTNVAAIDEISKLIYSLLEQRRAQCARQQEGRRPCFIGD